MAQPTTITIRVPPALRDTCGSLEFTLPAADVQGVLAELEQRYPALYTSICDETGAVRRHVNVFVNSARMRDRDGLGTKVGPGDVVTILPSVSGG